jgi:hypothetical protein
MEKMPSDSETKHLDSRKSIHLKIIYLKAYYFRRRRYYFFTTETDLPGMGKILWGKSLLQIKKEHDKLFLSDII